VAKTQEQAAEEIRTWLLAQRAERQGTHKPVSGERHNRYQSILDNQLYDSQPRDTPGASQEPTPQSVPSGAESHPSTPPKRGRSPKQVNLDPAKAAPSIGTLTITTVATDPVEAFFVTAGFADAMDEIAIDSPNDVHTITLTTTATAASTRTITWNDKEVREVTRVYNDSLEIYYENDSVPKRTPVANGKHERVLTSIPCGVLYRRKRDGTLVEASTPQR
jgi:hypothetical protein